MALSGSNIANGEENGEDEKVGMPPFCQLGSIAGFNVENT